MIQNIAVSAEKFIKKIDHSVKEFNGFLEKASMKTLLYFHGNLKNYPPAPAGSSYRRTMTLWRSITTLQGQDPQALSRVEKQGGFFGGEVVAIAGTRLKYAPYVIDENRQTKTHKANNWWTLQSEVRRMRDGIVDTYKGAMKEFTDKNLK
jgi:hypothetical protein